MLHMLRRSSGTLAVTLFALCASAVAQNQNDVVKASDPANGDGTLWFKSFGGSSSGGVELATHRVDGPVGMAAIHYAKLRWNSSQLLYDTGQFGFPGAPSIASQEVLLPAGGSLAPCLGAATFNGGFIVTEDFFGGLVAIRPHVGALVWTGTNLYAVEGHDEGGVAGAVVVQPILAGAFAGVVVLASKIQDIDAAVATADSRIVATALAYTSGAVFRITVDMADLTGITYTVSEVLDSAGASIPLLRGATVLNSGFTAPPGLPSAAEGAAVLWNGNHVFMYAHRATGDTLVEVLDTTVAPAVSITGCWGVMSVFFKGETTSLPPVLENCFEIFTGSRAILVSFSISPMILEEELSGGGSFPTDVSVGGSLIKRQASCLYEIQGRSTLASDQSRGMVIGHNQRSQ